uniref:G_PROTEIN_RECEP_F1_2 domain-containing protein n=1 Tax=Caenorhabditis japonica TaxID=281687 RepID=A0A8R1IS51_CAEJA
MMALSWDRCQAVVNPLQKRPLSRKRSVTAILVIWVLSTVTALPFAISASVNTFFTYDVVTSTVSKTHVCSAPVNSFCVQSCFKCDIIVRLGWKSSGRFRNVCAFSRRGVHTSNTRS